MLLCGRWQCWALCGSQLAFAFAELKPFVPLLLTYFFPATVRTSAPHLLQCGLRFGEEENDFTTRNSSNIVDLIVKVSLVKVRSEAKLS